METHLFTPPPDRLENTVHGAFRVRAATWFHYSLMVCLLIAPAPPPAGAQESSSPAAPDSLISTFTLTFSSKTSTAGIVPYREVERPRLGLALSGGGLRGIAQIGALKVLEENNIPVDYIVGTSIGAVVGGLYAAGYTPDELWQAIQALQLEKILVDTPSRSFLFLAEKEKRARALIELRMDRFKLQLPEAYTPGQRLSETLTGLILKAPSPAFYFSHLRIPLKIVTTDLLSGRKIVLSNGSLLDAMRASIAIPLLLAPVEIDSMLLVDGGLLDNIPVGETRSAGADIVVAINCTANLREKTDIHSPWTVADQVTTIMQQENNRAQLLNADVVIDFQDFSSTSVRKQDLVALFEEGQRRTREIIPQLLARLASRSVSAVNQPAVFFIDQIRLPDNPLFNWAALIDTTGNRPMSSEEITRCLENIYQTGHAADVRALVVRQPAGKTFLTFEVKTLPRLTSVHFHGNDVLSDSVLVQPFASLLHKSLNHHQVRAALQAVNRLYRSQGYSLSDVSQISFDEEAGAAHLYISEGRINAIQFLGHQKTRDFVLRREMPLHPGDTFQLSQAETGINNLFGTGLFHSVSLVAEPVGREWNLLVRLQEKAFDAIRLGVHYDEEQYGRSFLELANGNIFGTANELTLHAQYGTRQLFLSAQIHANRLFKTFMTSQINVYSQTEKFYYYQNNKVTGEYQRQANGLSMGLGLQIARFGTLSGFMRLENIQTKNVAGDRIIPSDLLVQTLGISSVVDTRDQVPFPSSGKYHKFSYEVTTGKHLGSDISFFKVQSQLMTFLTIGRRNTFSPKLIWGTSDMSLPFSEQYLLGGQESFYGLRQGERIGRNLIATSLEYRYRLPWNSLFDLYFSGRFDFGAVWKNYIKVQGGDFISGKGVSLAIKTPIGPIAVSYGVASRDQKRFYFSAGYRF